METATPPARRIGFFRSAKAFWHPHIALMLPLGFCMGVAFIWPAAFFAMAPRPDWKGVLGLLLPLLVLYSLNFIWAPTFDRLPLPRLTNRLGRRRSWMLVTHVACMAAMVMLGVFGPSAGLGTLLLIGLVVALASSSLSAVVNAYRIELLETERHGAGEVVTSFGLSLGGVAVPLDWALGNTGIGAVAHLAVPALLFVGVVIALFGPEPAVPREPDMGARENRFADAAARWGGAIVVWISRVFLAPLTEFLTRSAWLAVLGFFFLFKLGSGGSEIFFQAKTAAEIISSVGAIVGAMVVYARGPLPCLLFAASLLCLMNAVVSALGLVSAESIWIGLAHLVRLFGDGFGTIAVAAYAMGLCRPSYTATQFALFSSVMALAQMVPGPRSWIAELLGERPDSMFLSATLVSLLSLLLLRLLWKRRRREEARP